MKHHCHALGCDTPCAPRMLMCRACWMRVPPALRLEVTRTVVLRNPKRDASWAPWWRAMTEARVALGIASGAIDEAQAAAMREAGERTARALESVS